ncbi:MAG: hypothetical protein HZC02_02190 [Candidatus Levybacteria bacterium]|nr:hypothetical protein [Candidatus Levybacteria bacterium]
MDAVLTPLTQFFFNVIPGSLFLYVVYVFNLIPYAWKTSYIDPALGKNEVFILALLLIVGGGMGFVFQAITKLVREWFKLDELITMKVLCDNKDGMKMKKIWTRLRFTPNVHERIQVRKAFFLMDCYLRAEGKAHIIFHFSTRFAFWSNILVALILLGIIQAFAGINGVSDQIFSWYYLLVILVICVCYYHFRSLYDVVFKTFATSK